MRFAELVTIFGIGPSQPDAARALLAPPSMSLSSSDSPLVDALLDE